MKQIQQQLFSLRDAKYAEFQAKLTPGITLESCIGVRLPLLRKYATSLKNNPILEDFLNELPHQYYDENLLHSVILQNSVKSYEDCLAKVEKFLPFVDNWAVCDTLRPIVFKKHKEELLPKIRSWIYSSQTYTSRFGIDMLMTYYLDNDFKPEYLELPAMVKSDEYYVKMMVAWFYATALAKQWDCTVPYLEKGVLEKWTHNKTIQKAIESFRISDYQKEYLRSLKK